MRLGNTFRAFLQRLQDARTGRWSIYFQTRTAAVYPVREKHDTSSAPHRTTDMTPDNLTKVHTGYSETRQSKGHRVNVDTC